MGLKIPISSPLTESQAELTSKIGSMKSLLSIPIDKNLSIPKNNQISTFDYLIKVMRALGIEPEIMFNFFLDKIFDASGTFLEEKVLDAFADSMGQKGRELPSINNPLATQSQKEEFKKTNRAFLKGLIPATFIQVYKQQIAKNLTIMIFGPKTGPSLILNPNPLEVNRLFEDSICGEGLFSLSSDPITTPADAEYNRIALRKQLEKGEVIFEISCQEVKIKLPENPGFIFEGGGLFTAPSTAPMTPTQSLNILVQHVKNQSQNINNEENSNSTGKSFFEILITKFLNYISSLVFPFLGPIFTLVAPYSAASGLNNANTAYSNCDIMNSNPQEKQEKQEFFKSLANALLKELLRVLLVFTIKEFKKLVSNYYARTAAEKQKRRTAKVKQRFEIFNQIGANASKALKYATAAATLAVILGEAAS